MTEKKILIALIALLLNLVCFSGVILVNSYLISNDKIVNSFHVGNSELEIVEDFESPQQLTPGQVITKKVRIKNTGLCPCQTRVLVAFSDSKAQKNARIDYNLNDWELRDDGYWYSKTSLQPGEMSPCLFESVTIPGGAAPEDLKSFEIIVYSECVNVESGGFYD